MSLRNATLNQNHIKSFACSWLEMSWLLESTVIDPAKEGEIDQWANLWSQGLKI